MCVTLCRTGCKIVKFTQKSGTIFVKGFDEHGETMSAHTFRDGFLSEEKDEEDDDTEPSKIKKGKIMLIINKSNTGNSVHVPIEKLKPLSKINNMCKNGIVRIYITKTKNKSGGFNNILYIKTKIGQIGTCEIFIRDSPDKSVHFN
jgi:hypothetical protein